MSSSTSSSKYANLPFIASGEKDIYETDDLPEADQQPSHSQQQSDASIEIIPSGGIEVYQKFATVEANNLTAEDEKDKIESFVDRFKRLQLEIEDLRKEAESNKDSKVFSNEIENLFLNLENLHDVCFKKVDCSHMVRDLKETTTKPGVTDSGDEPVIYELYRKPDQDEVLEMAKLNALEQRLKRIESTLGLPADSAASCDSSLWNHYLKDRSIMNVVINLSNKMVQLDQSALDRIDARLNLISEKLTQIGEKKSSLTELDKEQKLAEIYDCYVKVDKQRVLIPNLLERIQVFNELQDQASKFSNTLNAMENIQADIRTSLSSNRENLENLKELLEKTQNIGKIVEDFHHRLNKLKQ